MRMYDLIYKKREGEELTTEEINYLVKGYTSGDIPDYQMSAWNMAVFFQGMNARETADLTTAMAESGEQIDLSDIGGIKVDKHSTGGVGDTTTLVLAPLVSSTGVPVAKMSGRGLGHTGGTIDKLESIPGYNVKVGMEDFIKQVNEIGVAVVGQTGNLTPADKKIYALRDVTATVKSIPLIASSIMSKKTAGGADGIVLDVKTGKGSFTPTLKESKNLASSMVEIGKEIGRQTIAVITDMNQPLGKAVGNALEVKEAVETLRGNGLEDMEKLCLTLGANMLIIADRVNDFEEGYELLKDKLDSGEALQQFKKLIKAQGGNSQIVEDLSVLPDADYKIDVVSDKSGYISGIDALEVGLTAMSVGAGRSTKEDEIDSAVGVVLSKKHGDYVNEGETLAVLHLNDKSAEEKAVNRLKDAFVIINKEPEKSTLIYDTIK